MQCAACNEWWQKNSRSFASMARHHERLVQVARDCLFDDFRPKHGCSSHLCCILCYCCWIAQSRACVCESLCGSVSMCMCMCVCVCLFCFVLFCFVLFVCLFVCFFVCFFVCLFVCLCLCLYVCVHFNMCHTAKTELSQSLSKLENRNAP